MPCQMLPAGCGWGAITGELEWRARFATAVRLVPKGRLIIAVDRYRGAREIRAFWTDHAFGWKTVAQSRRMKR